MIMTRPVRRIQLRTVLILAVALPIGAAAQEHPGHSPKRPWEYSSEERLARRFDKASIAERSVDPDTKRPRPGANIIDGAKNPELFMPHELYLAVVVDYLTGNPEWVARHRSAAEDQLRIFADPVAFWARLEQGSRPYTTALGRQNALAERFRTADPKQQRALRAQIDAGQVQQCAARAQAMAAVSALIGREVFYRFLYEIVAPDVASASDTADDQAAQLLFAERGCR